MIYGVEFVVFIALGGFFFCEFVQLLLPLVNDPTVARSLLGRWRSMCSLEKTRSRKCSLHFGTVRFCDALVPRGVDKPLTFLQEKLSTCGH